MIWLLTKKFGQQIFLIPPLNTSIYIFEYRISYVQYLIKKYQKFLLNSKTNSKICLSNLQNLINFVIITYKESWSKDCFFSLVSTSMPSNGSSLSDCPWQPLSSRSLNPLKRNSIKTTCVRVHRNCSKTPKDNLNEDDNRQPHVPRTTVSFHLTFASE